MKRIIFINRNTFDRITIGLGILGVALVLGISACGTLFQKQDESGNIPPAPGATQTNVILNPSYGVPLETIRDSGLPYVSEGAGVLLAILAGYVSARNRKLKKTAEILTKNISALQPTPEQLDDMASVQDTAGVRNEVRKLLPK